MDDGRRTDEDVAVSRDRGEDVAEALAELTGVLVDDGELADLLQRVADLALRTVADCAAASVTLVDGPGPRTAAHTGPLALGLDSTQYAARQGPCLDAARLVRTQAVDLARADRRWPAFTEAAQQAGVTAFLATPLVAGGRCVGALNLFSTTAGGFGEVDEALVELFCARAAVALANARLYGTAVALAQQLGDAMRSRAVIEQAKGVLMARDGLDADDAFILLTARSQHENRKLRDVAAETVRSCRTPPA